jgi:hyperosmotically inducible periplasmic protein
MPTYNLSKSLLMPAILLLSLTGCALFSGRESTGEYIDDATITSKVKAEILGESSLKVLQVNVETMQGVVQLSGFVDSAKSEYRAVEIARHVMGVKSVKDDLVIR